MNDRDKLIELIEQAEGLKNNDFPSVEEIADYLLANGVIVPPCKAEDILYQIVDMSHTACKSFVSDFSIKVLPHQIYYLNLMGGVSAIPFENFGKTVFLTKEEAEKALEGMKNG